MPVYDYVYQPWEGKRRGAVYRWMAIPKFAYMEFASRRMFIWLFTMSWLQFFIRLIYMYMLVNVGLLQSLNISVHLAPIDDFFFKNMIDVQLPFCFFFAFTMGPGLIARDTQHNALTLFTSKPISLWEYFAGKFSVIFMLTMAITWAQVALLLAVQVAIVEDTSPWRFYFKEQTLWVLGASLAYSLIIASSLSLMILAASSLTSNARYAGMAFVIYIIGASVFGLMLRGALENDAAMAVSPFHAVVQLGYDLFDLKNPDSLFGEKAAWTGILGNWALCGAILYRRLRRAGRQAH